MATYNAQNIGARKLDRVRQGFNSAHIIGITYAIVTGVIIFFFGKYLSYLFISDNAATIAVIPRPASSATPASMGISPYPMPWIPFLSALTK